MGWGMLQQVPPINVTPGPTGPLNWDGCTYTSKITSGYIVTAEEFNAEGLKERKRGEITVCIILNYSFFLLVKNISH
jgi:hypothetical protein